jgi:hypothetical protein
MSIQSRFWFNFLAEIFQAAEASPSGDIPVGAFAAHKLDRSCVVVYSSVTLPSTSCDGD